MYKTKLRALNEKRFKRWKTCLTLSTVVFLLAFFVWYFYLLSAVVGVRLLRRVKAVTKKSVKKKSTAKGKSTRESEAVASRVPVVSKKTPKKSTAVSTRAAVVGRKTVSKKKATRKSKAVRKRKGASKKKTDVSRMPLLKDSDALGVLVAFCGIRTRLVLMKVSSELKQCVISRIRLDSGPPMAKLGTSLSGALPVVECHSAEVPRIVKAASGGQFIVCVSQRCALLFAPSGDRWLVAVHCADGRVAVIGWKQGVEECSLRPIRSPITEKPTVSFVLNWQTRVGCDYRCDVRLAKNGDTIAVGTKFGITLLNADTGVVVFVMDKHKGEHVTFLEERRVVAGMNHVASDRYVLYEFTNNILTKEVHKSDGSSIESLKASANGKRLYLSDGDKLRVYRTDKWLVTACIQLSGRSQGQCDIAANGLLAQGIEGDCYNRIDVIEVNSHWLIQSIRTKHTGEIAQVVFSPDSSRIVSVASDGSVQLFDAITGEMVGEPRVGHRHWVSSVCFLSDALFVTFCIPLAL